MKRIALLTLCLLWSSSAFALYPTQYVEHTASPGSFAIVDAGKTATIHIDPADWPGVIRAAGDLAKDIARVTDKTPATSQDEKQLNKRAIIIGTVGRGGLVDRLVADNKINVDDIRGKWESFFLEVVKQPLPGVDSALVIAGSDKRGTIYGIYDLSESIGVSPWYWWADVPVVHRDALFVKAGRYVQGPPAVKYRGIFLNDEAPALSGWIGQNFKKFNHEFYAHVFELILRLRGNYLWPAMWDATFTADDPENPRLADEYGIVMSTSHHEPMMCAWKEWTKLGNKKGSWDYSKNDVALREFWTMGIERVKDYEKVITLAMRGDGDEPMSEQASVALLERIVADQRKIIADKINPNVAQVPQVWALYKEVQEYYEKGMRVPDDVTLLWCDDNWGNIRRLPTPAERNRAGGAGVYYHFDYVGGPRNYKWLNTNPIPKIWEQMNLAYEYGADRIWIVNVGDLKPMEFPIDFFLTMAWDPRAMTKEKLGKFTQRWAEQQFGTEHAAEIADIIAKYGKYNGRRKPELLEPTTYSLTDYGEADRIVDAFKAIVDQAEKIAPKLPKNAQDAFYQLVLHQPKACQIVNELYVTVGKNRLYAEQGRASTNDLAARARELFEADKAVTNYYNRELAGGKWNHFMDQTHIGYDNWQQPPNNKMPEVKEIELPEIAEIGVAVEGSRSAWFASSEEASLPTIDGFNQQRRWIDIFNKGKIAFEFTAVASAPWIVLSKSAGTIAKEERIWVSVDWNKAPKGAATGEIKIDGAGGAVVVKVPIFNPTEVNRESLQGFVEGEGCVSIEPAHFTKKIDGSSARWEQIDDYGRTLSGMSISPVTADSVAPPTDSPCLEYKMYLFKPGEVEVSTIVAPTLNFVPGRGLRFAVSLDDEPPQIVDALEKNTLQDWEESVRNNARTIKTKHKVTEPGYHALKVWMVDPAVVLQKIIVDTGGLKRSYLGPPESYRN